jgi:hypothetical protein
MTAGKAALLLLVVAGAVCLGSVSGSVCTPQEKDRLIHVCAIVIEKGAPPGWILEACCRMALEKQAATDKKWLDCIVSLLTDKDKQKYDPSKIRDLQTKCPPLGPTPPFDPVKRIYIVIIACIYTICNMHVG